VCTDGGLLARCHGPHGGSVPRLLSGSHNHTSTKLSFFVLQLASFFFEKEKGSTFTNKNPFIFYSLFAVIIPKSKLRVGSSSAVERFLHLLMLNIAFDFPANLKQGLVSRHDFKNPEPVFVNLLSISGIDSQPGRPRYDNAI
jgi:hypothetical protein